MNLTLIDQACYNRIQMRKKYLYFSFTILAVLLLLSTPVWAQQQIPIPKLNFIEQAKTPQDMAFSLQTLILLTVLALAPTILVMMTPFTRIVIVLSFMRQALGTQQAPPNQVLVGMALFMTLFVSMPMFTEVNEKALKPFLDNKINQEQAFNAGMKPFREFMFKQVRQPDLELYVDLAKIERPKTPNDVPSHVLIPAFITSELKTAFTIGFLVYLPFLIIDMVIASTLMSMGMMMLPPTIISLPFKLVLFVLIDGWNILSRSLVTSFF